MTCNYIKHQDSNLTPIELLSRETEVNNFFDQQLADFKKWVYDNPQLFSKDE